MKGTSLILQGRIHTETCLLILPQSVSSLKPLTEPSKHTVLNMHILHGKLLEMFPCSLCNRHVSLHKPRKGWLPAVCTIIYSEAVEEETLGHKHATQYANQSVLLMLIGCTDIGLRILESLPYTCFSPTRTKVIEAICQLNAFIAFSYKMFYFTANWVFCSRRPITANVNMHF